MPVTCWNMLNAGFGARVRSKGRRPWLSHQWLGSVELSRMDFQISGPVKLLNVVFHPRE